MSDKTVLIGIDPGSVNGGIAVRWPMGRVIVEKLDTESLVCLWAHISSYAPSEDFPDVYCYIENVGRAFPGNASKAVTTFARHCGHIEMAIVACEIPFEPVLPKIWMNDVVPDRPKGIKDKAKRKTHIYQVMSNIFTQVKVYKYNSDALAILKYGMNKHGL